MAKVYVVTSGEDSDYRIQGVFSTEQGAAQLRADIGRDAEIEEYELDRWPEGPPRRTVYAAYISVSGEVDDADADRKVCDPQYTRVLGDTWYTNHARPEGFMFAESAVSREHARQLAAEARQAWLRDRAAETVTPAAWPSGDRRS